MQNTTRSPTNNDNSILVELGPTTTIAHEIPVDMETVRAFVPATAYDIPLKVMPTFKVDSFEMESVTAINSFEEDAVTGCAHEFILEVETVSTRLCLTFLNHEMETSLPLNE